ncbi:GAF domain-containing protein [Novosphingobium ovatum]|uniref:GAF domain-containing protein n=1 Tax=Novosphingobium ovatum TaxID=1908523 RepID=UPI001D1146CB|nr:GAF domain-containing protein [Novosphingobium ovatum]
MKTIQSDRAAAQSAVAASWCRSAYRHGLDPATHRRRDRVENTGLIERRQANETLLAAANPVLDNLFNNVGRSGCCVILSDIDGIVLESRATAGERALFDAMGLAAGAEWSEQAEGTNGIGTCLIEGRPVAILRHEHFSSRNVDISCMDAPVFGPDGRLVAALDVSTGRPEHGSELAGMILALVQDAARQIERDYFCQHYAQARIVYAGDEKTAGSALLAVDKDDLVIGATRAARARYGLGMSGLTAPRPLGDVMGMADPVGLDAHEAKALRQALARCDGNVSAAARELGIGRATMYRRMERLGLLG